MGRRDRLRETFERATGVALRPLAEVHRLEESEVEMRGKQREMQDLAYTIMDYAAGAPQEVKAQERRNLVQRARVVWQQDPQYGGTINLLNEFVLGRGIPKPAAVDEDLQKIVVDRFWEDNDNKRIITTHGAQVRFNTDLSLQSNMFPLVYDDGEDGLVKLGLLAHDTVEEAVRDPDARLRVLYYFTRSYNRVWDVNKHAYVVSSERNRVRYYEDVQNLRDAQADDEAGIRKEPLPNIPDALIGRGRVMHVAVNRTMEQAFGVPEIARTIRWVTAYNDLMRARVDMAKAAASIIMRRKLKGGAAGMHQLASQALLQAGAVPTQPNVDPMSLGQAPRPGSILEENDWVEHESFNLNSGSAGAMQDAQMIRSQFSAGTGWPASYLGDASNGGSLAGATSIELRILKMVEQRQQTIEDFITACVQRAIERALETGKLSKYRPMTPEEIKRKAADDDEAATATATPGAAPAAVQQAARLRLVTNDEEDDEPPEGYIERDLSFSVQMPSPLRRSMGDLVTAISTIAKTFDPNNTNMEMSKTLLSIALGEGLEVDDPSAAVERIFPKGYVDPAMLAGGAPSLGAGQFTPDAGPVGADGLQHPNPDNPYGAPQMSQLADVNEAEGMSAPRFDQLGDEMVVRLHDRYGELMDPRVQESILRRAVIAQGQAPTQAGRAAGAKLGQQRMTASDIEADDVLGPALAKALKQVAT